MVGQSTSCCLVSISLFLQTQPYHLQLEIIFLTSLLHKNESPLMWLIIFLQKDVLLVYVVCHVVPSVVVSCDRLLGVRGMKDHRIILICLRNISQNVLGQLTQLHTHILHTELFTTLVLTRILLCTVYNRPAVFLQ